MRQTIRTLFLILPAALLAAPCFSQIQRPKYDPPATMRAVAQLLQHGHVSSAPLDDRISERAFAVLIKNLDPLGLYLLQSDVDQLRAHRSELDDALLRGDDSFAQKLQELYQQRVGEGIDLGLRWLGAPHDFTLDETMALDVELDGHARTREELDDRWRRRIKYDLLVLAGDGIEGDAAEQRLRRRYERMAERIMLRAPEDVDAGFIEAIAASFDPHTSYMPPRVAENFAIHMRTNYEGIGAVLRDEDGRVVITEVMPGSAAQQSGQLTAGDVIQGVGQGEDGEIQSIVGMELDDVVDKIRGPRDTVVRLSVTTGKAAPRIIVLRRKRTELVESLASSKVIERDGHKIGWIDLPGFYADPRGEHSATRDTARFLAEFTAAGVDSVVLDLRQNGGGLLPEAVSLTGLFLDTGNVVQVRGPGGRIDRLDDEEPGAAWTGPLVVLVSRFSASASEIVAGAIVDQGRGLVIGDSATHGKGTVQRVLDLARHGLRRGDRPGGALKLTVQQFFRPGGDSTQLHGVASDIVLPSWSESVAEGERALPYALPFAHIDPAVEQPLLQRDAALIATLAKASAARCAEQPQFQELVAASARRAQWLQQKVVPLQKQAFATWRGERQLLRPGAKPAGSEADAYVGEVCRIAGDYADGLRKHGV